MKFKITYTNPDTGDTETSIRDFVDSPKAKVESPLFPPYFVNITAREWAEDYAYAIADGGPYSIMEVKNY
jgi:hypothetical protein